MNDQNEYIGYEVRGIEERGHTQITHSLYSPDTSACTLDRGVFLTPTISYPIIILLIFYVLNMDIKITSLSFLFLVSPFLWKLFSLFPDIHQPALFWNIYSKFEYNTCNLIPNKNKDILYYYIRPNLAITLRKIIAMQKWYKSFLFFSIFPG